MLYTVAVRASYILPILKRFLDENPIKPGVGLSPPVNNENRNHFAILSFGVDPQNWKSVRWHVALLPGALVDTHLRPMKKRKARRKLKVIMTKSTPKSSRFYSLATDYKFWYVRYLNRSDCFFSNFVNLNRVTANKLLRKSKRASNLSLANNKQENQVATLKDFVCQE